MNYSEHCCSRECFGCDVVNVIQTTSYHSLLQCFFEHSLHHHIYIYMSYLQRILAGIIGFHVLNVQLDIELVYLQHI